jgi:hypothetical protein
LNFCVKRINGLFRAFGQSEDGRSAFVRLSLANFTMAFIEVLILQGILTFSHNVGEFSRVPGLTVEDWQI